MELKQIREGGKLTISIIGELNTLTAQDLEDILGDNLADVDELVFDLAQMEYTSSAGLRAFLGALQYMEEKDGSLVVRNANDLVMEIFASTGFDTILEIEA